MQADARRADLDADAVLEDGFGGVDGDLVVGLVAVLEAEVIVLEVDVEERQDEVLADLVPATGGAVWESGGGRKRGAAWAAVRVREESRLVSACTIYR